MSGDVTKLQDPYNKIGSQEKRYLRVKTEVESHTFSELGINESKLIRMVWTEIKSSILIWDLSTVAILVMEKIAAM